MHRSMSFVGIMYVVLPKLSPNGLIGDYAEPKLPNRPKSKLDGYYRLNINDGVPALHTVPAFVLFKIKQK